MREYIHRQGAWWWRCYACGERVDGVILRHRAEQDAERAEQREALERDLHDWQIWLARMPG